MIDRSVALDQAAARCPPIWPKWTWNLVGEQAIFLLHHGSRERAGDPRPGAGAPPIRADGGGADPALPGLDKAGCAPQVAGA